MLVGFGLSARPALSPNVVPCLDRRSCGEPLALVTFGRGESWELTARARRGVLAVCTECVIVETTSWSCRETHKSFKTGIMKPILGNYSMNILPPCPQNTFKESGRSEVYGSDIPISDVGGASRLFDTSGSLKSGASCGH